MTFGKGERGGVFYIPLSSLKITDSIYAGKHSVALVLGLHKQQQKSVESQKNSCTCDNTVGVPFINLYFMLHMINTFHQKAKKEQHFG